MGQTALVRAPTWMRYSMLCGCAPDADADAHTLLEELFSVSHHAPPTDPLAKRFGYILKPWLLRRFVQTIRLPRRDAVIIMDSDGFVAWGGARRMPALPTAQMYGYGDRWLGQICSGETADICPNITAAEARAHYALGVPYLLTVPAFEAIARTWIYYMRRVTQRVWPSILADQVASESPPTAKPAPHLLAR